MAETKQRPTTNVTFGPQWWRRHYAMDFGEPFWRDPVARTERDVRQRRLLFERFGDVGLGERDPGPRPNIEAYGHRFMAAFWGCPIIYLPDQAPSARVLPDARARMERLEVPDLGASPVVQHAIAEARLLRERYGSCSGDFNSGGPLNNAVSVFGEEMLVICATAPKLAQSVLRKMGEALLAVHNQMTCPINGVDASLPRTWGGLANCPVGMISPTTYREVVFPIDKWYRQRQRCRGPWKLHHCGVFHPYAETYRLLNPTEIDVGRGTDYAATRRVFPRTPISIEIHPLDLAGQSQKDMDGLLQRIVREAGPPELVTRLWVAEAGTELSDESVRDFVTAPARIFQEEAEEKR